MNMFALIYTQKERQMDRQTQKKGQKDRLRQIQKKVLKVGLGWITICSPTLKRKRERQERDSKRKKYYMNNNLFALLKIDRQRQKRL